MEVARSASLELDWRHSESKRTAVAEGGHVTSLADGHVTSLAGGSRIRSGSLATHGRWASRSLDI